MTLFLLVAALAAQTAPAPAPAAAPVPAPQWESFHSDASGSFEVDTTRLGRDGDQVDAWVRQVYAQPQPPFGMKTFVLHNRVDCRRRRAITFSMEGFTEDGSSMGLLDYPENQRPNERLTRQGSDGAMLRRLCEGAAE